MGKGALNTKSFGFAIRIIKLSQYLRDEKKEFVISNQVLRSGTAIGASIREAEYAESMSDFIPKFMFH
jgi:four helix bundle protein